MTSKNKAALSVQAYLKRKKLSKQLDPEVIHSFDGTLDLRVSDLETLIVASLTPHPPAWQHINEGVAPNIGLFRFDNDGPVYAKWNGRDRFGAYVTPRGKCKACGGSCEEEYVNQYFPLPHPPTEGEKK